MCSGTNAVLATKPAPAIGASAHAQQMVLKPAPFSVGLRAIDTAPSGNPRPNVAIAEEGGVVQNLALKLFISTSCSFAWVQPVCFSFDYDCSSPGLRMMTCLVITGVNKPKGPRTGTGAARQARTGKAAAFKRPGMYACEMHLYAKTTLASMEVMKLELSVSVSAVADSS